MGTERFTMPLAVRTYEVDAAGDVPPAAFLRWFQELAVRASAARGFDDDRYRQLSATWVVGEFSLEVLAPVGAGDELVGATWVADIQRVNSHREYRLTRPDGSVVANGEAVWVYVDRRTGRPKRLPDEMRATFAPTGDYALSEPTWGADLLGTEPQAGAHRIAHEVTWSELDAARHVNNAVYAQWISDHLASLDEERPRVSRLRIAYARPVKGDETVEWRLHPVGGGVWLHWAMRDGGQQVATRAVIEAGS